ncbi:MAG TPA: sigma-70 family RNA polymerase sigma factor, partial [Bacteroidales bacterium]|nr:sigma-70 family RNA polymerase sigma factor [Bacteroidales bacterium]
HKAMDTLLERHRRKIYGYIKHLVKDATLAEDLFQDTFVKVIRSLRQGNYHDDGKFIAWVMRIAHNLVIDHFRREKNYKEVSNEQGEYDLFNNMKYSQETVDITWAREQISKDVKKLIQQLPEEQKNIVIMRLYLDMSFKEIAEHTEVSINTALGRMRYAIINMRKMMEEKQMSLTLQ